MIRIKCYTRKSCDACKIMIHILTDIIVNNNVDISFGIRHYRGNEEEFQNNNIKLFPTTIIFKNDKEIARLEGSYSKEYLIDVINKLKEEK